MNINMKMVYDAKNVEDLLHFYDKIDLFPNVGHRKVTVKCLTMSECLLASNNRTVSMDSCTDADVTANRCCQLLMGHSTCSRNSHGYLTSCYG